MSRLKGGVEYLSWGVAHLSLTPSPHDSGRADELSREAFPCLNQTSKLNNKILVNWVGIGGKCIVMLGDAARAIYCFLPKRWVANSAQMRPGRMNWGRNSRHLVQLASRVTSASEVLGTSVIQHRPTTI